jgi:hypothetical protein
MSQNFNLHENCSCNSCQQLSEAEKKLHLEISQNSRREFFKNAGKLGLGIGIGGGLISPRRFCIGILMNLLTKQIN